MLQYGSFNTTMKNIFMLQYGSNVYLFTHLEEKTQEDLEWALEKAICNTYEKVLRNARKEEQIVLTVNLIQAALPQMAKYGFDYFKHTSCVINQCSDFIKDGEQENSFLKSCRGATVWNKIAEHNNKYL